MAIVWPCHLSVDAYVALGKELVVARPDCPGCSAPMVFWSTYRRPVRVVGRCVKILIRRARCTPCSVTHALLPAFVLVKRLDVAEAIGKAIGDVLDQVSGVRPVAVRLVVPHTTARGWLRRFALRSAELSVSFAALGVELGADAKAPLADQEQGALCALRAAYAAASNLPGWAAVSPWRFFAAVSGGRLLSANTISPYLVIGKRRFMPPVPLPETTKDEPGGTCP